MALHRRITLIYGETESGKSTVAKALLKTCEHVVVIDPMAEYGGDGWSVCETRRGVQAAVLDRIAKRRPLRLAYRCGGRHQTEAPWLARALWSFQGPGWRQGGPVITLVMEEAHLYYRALGVQPPECAIFDELVLTGKHRGIEILGITQRPAGVSTNLRGNVGEIWALHMPRADDRRAAEEKCAGVADKIKNLPDYHVLRIGRRSVEMWKTTKGGKLVPADKAASPR